MLPEYVDYQRETLVLKTDDPTCEQLAQKHSPSEFILAGLFLHLALVEENWMEVRCAGLPDREPWSGSEWEADPNWQFRAAAQVEPVQLQSRYRESSARSRAIASKSTGLDQLSVKALRHGRHFSLRWVLQNLIEKTARHSGHSDFPREAIDGTVGE